MNYAELARLYEARLRPVAAAWAYEVAIASGDAQLAEYMDLAALYFVTARMEYADPAEDREFCDAAYDRAHAVLGAAEERFGSSTEAAYWRLMLRSRVLYEDVKTDEFAALAQLGGSPLPGLEVYLRTEDEKYRGDALRALESATGVETGRARYIASFVL